MHQKPYEIQNALIEQSAVANYFNRTVIASPEAPFKKSWICPCKANHLGFLLVIYMYGIFSFAVDFNGHSGRNQHQLEYDKWSLAYMGTSIWNRSTTA